MTTKNKFAELKEKMETLRSEMKAKAKEFFQENSKELFEKYPNLESFGWSQYTPHWNDGDPCTFSSHAYDYIHLVLAGEDEEENDENYEYTDSPSTERGKIGNQVFDFLKSFDNDDFEDLFGDHVTVTVSRTGVETDEYCHD